MGRGRTRGARTQPIPSQISFETQEDYLRFIGKNASSPTLPQQRLNCEHRTRSLHPGFALDAQTLIDVAPELPGLLHVLRHFEANPRPGRFARELPLPVDTKFIERHQKLLREWFDVVLPPQSIRADEDHFERRYGLRDPEPHILVRLLDPQLQRELGFPCDEFSLPLRTLGVLAVQRATAIIVENKVNLLTLPPMRRFIGFGALGDGVTLLRDVSGSTPSKSFTGETSTLKGSRFCRRCVPSSRTRKVFLWIRLLSTRGTTWPVAETGAPRGSSPCGWRAPSISAVL